MPIATLCAWHAFCYCRIFAILTAHISRKIKNKIRCSFFASFECASVSDCSVAGCGDIDENVQFFA